MELNKNNFLRWNGAFTPKPFSNIANNDAQSMVVSAASCVLYPLSNDESTFGIDPNTFQITEQDNLVNPAVWDASLLKVTYFPPSGVAVGNRTLKYNWKDTEGNLSNEATITINIQARPTSWRVYPDSFSCQMSGGVRTGNGQFDLLEKYYTDDNSTVFPLETKPNSPGDPNYLAPFPDPINCSTNPYVRWDLSPDVTVNGACSVMSATMAVYTAYTDTFLTVGTRMYIDNSLNTPVGDLYYSDYSVAYRTIDGYIVDIYNCGV